MCCRDLNPNASLSFRDHGVAESDHGDAFPQERGCHILGELCIVEHNGNDGVHPGLR
jgi:hypothetical protein